MNRNAATSERSVPFRGRSLDGDPGCWCRTIFFWWCWHKGTESILDVSDDLWCFETQSVKWRQIQKSGDWPNARRCAGICASGRTIQLWGGSGIETTEGATRYTFLNDWWQLIYDNNSWQCLQVLALISVSISHDDTSRPVPRYTPVFLSIDGGYFLFGGYTEDCVGKRKLNDAWMVRKSSWDEIQGNKDAGYPAQPNGLACDMAVCQRLMGKMFISVGGSLMMVITTTFGVSIVPRKNGWCCRRTKS